jgi:protein-disulfide isomerase
MAEKKEKKNWLQPILVVLLILAAFAIGTLWTELRLLKGKKSLAPTAQQGQEQAAAPDEENVELDKDLWQEVSQTGAGIMGSDQAKITMVEFTDYQCPFCERYVTETLTQLEKEYVETNQVRYVVRDLPLAFHPNSHLAAEAARCAADQGKYWEYHDKLFATQADWSEGDAQTLFAQYAGALGLNQGEFSTCLSQGKFKQAVEDDLALAERAGAGGTPTFFINGKELVGAQPYTAFKTLIDQELK